MALSSECEVHDWCWDPSDEIGCPICYGIELGKQRAIKVVESGGWAGESLSEDIANLTALIEEEDK